MTEFLTYQADNEHRRARLIQFLAEFFYTIKYVLLYPFGLLIKKKNMPEGEQRPVLFVPGVMGSSLTFAKLAKKLHEHGHPVYFFNNGFSFGSIRSKSQQLESFILDKQLDECYLVAHSTGGLAAMGLGYRGRDRIYKLLALGTPFKGTWFALFGLFFPAVFQSLPLSPYLKKMDINFTTFLNAQGIFARGDQAIWPSKNSRLGRFDDVQIPEYGHFNLVMGPMGLACVSELIESEDSKNPRGAKKAEPAEEVAKAPAKKTRKKAAPAKKKKKAPAKKSKKTTKTKKTKTRKKSR